MRTSVKSMAQIRIKLEMNKGRKGMPLDKLAAVAGATEKFLVSFSRDIGLGKTQCQWLAERFENNSVDFDCRFASDVDESVATRGRRGLRAVLGNRYEDSEVAALILPKTRLQFARIADPLDPDEVIRFGIYQNGEDRPTDWFELTQSRLAEIQSPLKAGRRSFGEVQCIVHAFFKETHRPYFKVRELSTQELLNCYFEPAMYSAAVQVLEEQDAVVFIEGWTTENPETGFVDSIEATGFRLAPSFSPEEYRAGLGSIPDYTENRPTSEAIEMMRNG